jgi:hypothetical protein
VGALIEVVEVLGVDSVGRMHDGVPSERPKSGAMLPAAGETVQRYLSKRDSLTLLLF